MSRLIAPRAAACAVLLVAGACARRTAATGPAHADSTAIRRDVAYLADDRLEGRATGTAGNDSAAAYIARRYAALGLRYFGDGYLQRFNARSVADAHAGRTTPRPSQNVVAWLPGRDPALRGQYVVVGAHFDHLGRSSEGALDVDAGNAIRNGADDNASGTAAVMELARLLTRHPPRRSVVFANFTGEELGLLGSHWLVEHPPFPLDSVIAMLNFDMVGRLRDDKLIVYGTATATELAALLDSANADQAARLSVRGIGDGYGPSDQSSFYEKGIPVLHFFTDLHDDYHRATDDADKILAGGEARVVDLAADVAQRLADRPARLTFVRQAAPQITTREGGGNAYLGSVPDMGAVDVVGLRLSGVRAGSPADQAGLRAGDVIVELGGKSVKDIYEYTSALYAHQPGETVKIVVMRGTDRVEVMATLGRRGQ